MIRDVIDTRPPGGSSSELSTPICTMADVADVVTSIPVATLAMEHCSCGEQHRKLSSSHVDTCSVWRRRGRADVFPSLRRGHCDGQNPLKAAQLVATPKGGLDVTPEVMNASQGSCSLVETSVSSVSAVWLRAT